MATQRTLLAMGGAVLTWLPLAALSLLEGPVALLAFLLLSIGWILQALARAADVRRQLSAVSASPAPPLSSLPARFDWPLTAEEPFLRRRSRRSLVVFCTCIGIIFLAVFLKLIFVDNLGASLLEVTVFISTALLIVVWGWLFLRPAPALELSPSGFKVGRQRLLFANEVRLSLVSDSWWALLFNPTSRFRVTVTSGGQSVSIRPYVYVESDSSASPAGPDPYLARARQDTLRFRELVHGLLSLATDGNARGWLASSFPPPGPHERLDAQTQRAARSVRALHPAVGLALAALVVITAFVVVMTILLAARAYG